VAEKPIILSDQKRTKRKKKTSRKAEDTAKKRKQNWHTPIYTILQTLQQNGKKRLDVHGTPNKQRKTRAPAKEEESRTKADRDPNPSSAKTRKNK
jgi:hypothetical protein